MASLRIKNPTTNKWWNHAFGWVERYNHATLYPDGTPRDMQLPAGGVWYLASAKKEGVTINDFLRPELDKVFGENK